MPDTDLQVENNIIKIQSWFRGCIFRVKKLPLVMYKIQRYLQSSISISSFSSQNKDGRINSCADEDTVIKLLLDEFKDKIIVPEKSRKWYDILVYDYTYGWIPVNVKSTKTTTNDNTGNLAMCVHAYTDEIIDIHSDKSCNNGKMSNILFEKIRDKKYNLNYKKDYYFLVLNKADISDVIINSVKGLSKLTSNINNLPFQVCWNKNRTFKYEHINKKIKIFIDSLQKPKPSWKEPFMRNIRTLKIV